MVSRQSGPFVSIGAILLAAVAASGQTDRYVIFSDVPDQTWIIQNGAISATWAHQTNDLAPAVRDTIRAIRWDHAGNGNEYRFDGSLTGTTYPDPGGAGQILDGAASADNNYYAEWAGGGAVYQCGPDWANPTRLFSTGANYTGITYDSSDDTLWLAVDQSGTIENRTLGGNLIRSFSAGGGRWGCLAYEASSDTLWMVNNGTSEIRQYDKNGNQLGSFNVGSFGNVWGGEFPAGQGTRYSLSVSGQCPGQVTVRWNNATPNTQQGLVFGQNQGSTTIPTGICQGTVLGLQGGVQLVRTLPTGNGSGSVSGNAGTAACRHYLQLVEAPSCNTSNVAQIP